MVVSVGSPLQRWSSALSVPFLEELQQSFKQFRCA
ncbi:hypothetical protein LEMLEM_LOCUS18943 [Lemmus lemmus]